MTAVAPAPTDDDVSMDTWKQVDDLESTVNSILEYTGSPRKKPQSRPDPVPWPTKLGYGLPQFCMLSLTLVISIFVNTYYERMGAALSFIAFFTALARSFDVMTDPLMGWISDNTRLSFGRRRPYMLTGMFGFAIAFILLMSPPRDRVGRQTSYWFGVFYVMFYIFDTIANVPYQALGPELTTDSLERTEVFFWGKAYAGLGVLVGATSPWMFKQLLGNGEDLDTLRQSFVLVGVTFGALYVLFMGFVVAVVKERHGDVGATQIPLVPSVLRSLKNNAFRPLLVGWIFDALSLSFLSTMFPFFIIYVIKPDPNIISADTTQAACFGALFTSALLSMPLWKKLSLRYGRYPMYMAFNLLNFVTNALYVVVNEGDPYTTIGITALNGLPLGGTFLIDSILADVIDYDEFLNGTRNEGGFTVFSSFIPKFVSVPASALPLSLMAMMGFVPSKANGEIQPQPALVKHFIRFVFVVAPCMCALIAFFVKRAFPITEESMMDKIADGILKHKNGEPAFDPVTGVMVEILSLDEKELQMAWTLDNFSPDQLRALLEENFSSKYKKDADGNSDFEEAMVGDNDAVVVRATSLIRSMRQHIVFGALLFGVNVGLVAGFFNQIDDPAISVIPIVAVVLAGMALCFFVFSLKRLQAAHLLVRQNIPKQLIKEIYDHKTLGQRGGTVNNNVKSHIDAKRYRHVIDKLRAQRDFAMEQKADVEKEKDSLQYQLQSALKRLDASARVGVDSAHSDYDHEPAHRRSSGRSDGSNPLPPLMDRSNGKSTILWKAVADEPDQRERRRSLTRHNTETEF